MTYKENISAILECHFAGFKEEIIDSACNRILELEPRKDEVVLTNKEYREEISNEYERGYCKGYSEALEQQKLTLDKILNFIEDNYPTAISTDWEKACAYVLNEVEKIVKAGSKEK